MGLGFGLGFDGGVEVDDFDDGGVEGVGYVVDFCVGGFGDFFDGVGGGVDFGLGEGVEGWWGGGGVGVEGWVFFFWVGLWWFLW